MGLSFTIQLIIMLTDNCPLRQLYELNFITEHFSKLKVVINGGGLQVHCNSLTSKGEQHWEKLRNYLLVITKAE